MEAAVTSFGYFIEKLSYLSLGLRMYNLHMSHVCTCTSVHWYIVFSLLGVGCFGVASIFISQHIPSKMFTVLRLIDLEALSGGQLEDVQNEMKLSQLLHHCNIARYLCSFVVGSKLWAIQPLMHYGECFLIDNNFALLHCHVVHTCTCTCMRVHVCIYMLLYI